MAKGTKKLQLNKLMKDKALSQKKRASFEKIVTGGVRKKKMKFKHNIVNAEKNAKTILANLTQGGEASAIKLTTVRKDVKNTKPNAKKRVKRLNEPLTSGGKAVASTTSENPLPESSSANHKEREAKLKPSPSTMVKDVIYATPDNQPPNKSSVSGKKKRKKSKPSVTLEGKNVGCSIPESLLSKSAQANDKKIVEKFTSPLTAMVKDVASVTAVNNLPQNSSSAKKKRKNFKTSFKTKGKDAGSTSPENSHPENVSANAKKRRKSLKSPSSIETPQKTVDSLVKIVSNFKRSKDTVSSNWQAFLASGLNISKSKDTKPSFSRKETKEKLNNDSKTNVNSKSLSAIKSPVEVVDDSDACEYVHEHNKGKHELTKFIAMDCEMVGVYDGNESVLARISLVNQHGECVYDKFVKPKEAVADYRTKVSGIRPSDLKRGEEFEVVQKEVAAILRGRILVGHALHNDLRVLMLNHPWGIRDTAKFKLFRNITKGKTPSLKTLAKEILGVNIQSGEHSSVEDARAAMQLYNLYQKEWEGSRLHKRGQRRQNIAPASGNQPESFVRNHKKGTQISNPLMDEFAACSLY